MFDDVRDLYHDIILRHSREPRYMRRLEVFDARATGDNPMCGDKCEVRLRRGGDGFIADIGFEARGCAISLASADLMAEAVDGRSVEQARALAGDFFELVRSGTSDSPDPAIELVKPLAGVAEYPSRIKCATLPWAALLAALDGAGEASSE
jgi:nitrogen fixation NifU-like protein